MPRLGNLIQPLYSWKFIHPEAKFHYVTDVAHANALIASLHGPVGFDLEWKPSYRKGQPENPVSIVQLANHHLILVVQVSAMPEFPVKLQEFLENPEYPKAGVGIQNDVKKLYRDFRVSTYNCVDISLLARSVDNNQWKGKFSNPIGLARLVEAYEGCRLPKGKVNRSNWESVLTSAQQDYAGNDAHAGYVLYTKLMAMIQLMTTIPKSVYYNFDAVRGRLCEPSGMSWFAYNPDYDPGPPPAKEGEPKSSNPTIPPSAIMETLSARPLRSL